MRRSLRRRCRAASAPSATAAVAADWYQKNEVQARWQRRARFVSFRFVCFSGGGWPKGGCCVGGASSLLSLLLFPFDESWTWNTTLTTTMTTQTTTTTRSARLATAISDSIALSDGATQCAAAAAAACYCCLAPPTDVDSAACWLLCCCFFFVVLLSSHRPHTHTHTLPVTNAVIKCAAISLAHTHTYADSDAG